MCLILARKSVNCEEKSYGVVLFVIGAAAEAGRGGGLRRSSGGGPAVGPAKSLGSVRVGAGTDGGQTGRGPQRKAGGSGNLRRSSGEGAAMRPAKPLGSVRSGTGADGQAGRGPQRRSRGRADRRKAGEPVGPRQGRGRGRGGERGGGMPAVRRRVGPRVRRVQGDGGRGPAAWSRVERHLPRGASVRDVGPQLHASEETMSCNGRVIFGGLSWWCRCRAATGLASHREGGVAAFGGVAAGLRQQGTEGGVAVPGGGAVRAVAGRAGGVRPAAQQRRQKRVGATFWGSRNGLWVLAGREGRSEDRSGKDIRSSPGKNGPEWITEERRPDLLS